MNGSNYSINESINGFTSRSDMSEKGEKWKRESQGYPEALELRNWKDGAVSNCWEAGLGYQQLV